MPQYELSCESCDLVFVELLRINEQNPNCPKCNKKTKRLISVCNGVVTGSEHRSLDCIIGADSEKKWQAVEKRKQERLKKSKE